MRTDSWRPSCSIEQLKERAKLYAAIRSFFANRAVLEVDTPVLSNAASCDANLDSFRVDSRYYLQTSPEFSMKRLLAAGSGSIYQISHSFRQAESGRFHNPEFTLLEWYRLDWKMAELIQEVVELLKECIRLSDKSAKVQAAIVFKHISYFELFHSTTDIDPHQTTVAELRAFVHAQNNPEADNICGERLSDWLDYIFSMYIQPNLADKTIFVVSHYPRCQAMLAKLSQQTPVTAMRFEVFYNSVELANGYEELTDPLVQQARFESELLQRQQMGMPLVPMDKNLVGALAHGLPACSGVALGLDRLLMQLQAVDSINQVLSFPIDRA